TSQEVFKVYRSIIPDINLDPENDSILFDITHGFRSMATLMYQALQFSFSKIQNIELVYGEFISRDQISYVRNLSSYVPYAKAADAISIFNSKLDATNLISCIKAEWPDGADALEKFSKVVQANFSLQIQETLNQINNAIKALPAEKSTILQDVVDALQPICNLRDERMSRTIYNYARFQYEHGLIVQSIISLQIAVETAIAERYEVKDAAGNNTSIGDYLWYYGGYRYDNSGNKITIKAIGSPKLKAIWNTNMKMKQKLRNLEHFRNQVAHGGARNPDTGGFPLVQNLAAQYTSGKEGVELLFRYLDENPEN
ncbi:MAG: TM1812 family CRISPR-associated protein, partial [Treponema sp.]|nr:TM1812 family CRISPR-associated protein [Treponema sp.]